jgi:5-formyltetrahydrofolate cyclo-ligase
MTIESDIDLGEAKRRVRQQALAARAGRDPTASGVALAGQVMHDLPPPPGVIVAGFLPIGDEIDLLPLLRALHDRGHPIALPVTPKRGLPLTFRRWIPGGELVEERFGTRRPTGPDCTPDFLLIPLLAFDSKGGRLGYGGGFYDRTLAALPNRFRLGCAFAAQQVDAVPVGPYDIRLDAVATENGIIRCGDQCENSVSG